MMPASSPSLPGALTADAPAAATIPFDYAAAFELRGEPGRTTQDVIAIAGDGAFVAVAIGYGFEENRRRPVTRPPSPPPLIEFSADPMLGDFAVDTWIDGVKLDPQFNPVLESAAAGLGGSAPPSFVAGASRSPFQRVSPLAELSFLLSIVDTATGRELQDEPTHSLAALGAADGRRPFRALGRPVTLAPRTTLRVEVTERTPDARGTLFVVFVGYKVLDQQACTPARAAARVARDPGSRVVPFDYVVSLDLLGVPGRLAEAEVPVVTDAGAAVTAIGYGLDMPAPTVRFDRSLAPANTVTGLMNLRTAPLSAIGVDAMLDGVRLRPAMLPLAVDGGGLLANAIAPNLADRLFERLTTPGDVSFRYAFSDVATGRELQNRPINNLAGLGSADGRRPFKQLARPLELEPRSVLRVVVEERSGRGRLYFAFQGFKVLQAARRWT